MKITVVYGGRGLIEDPALYVLEKMQVVLDELRVDVQRINLYEDRNQITTLPAMLKETDGVVLGVSLEWFGIGGYMQEFLDACWLYGDKDKIASLYMMPVVLATTSGEKDAELSLIKAWEVLGGLPADGICAYVENPVDFELNKEYGRVIEKKTEQLYRTINQKQVVMPSSSTVIRNKVLKPKTIDLTPQESEQLSKFVSDDVYVKQQKEDIEELAVLFKGMLGDEGENAVKETPEADDSDNADVNGNNNGNNGNNNGSNTNSNVSNSNNIKKSITEETFKEIKEEPQTVNSNPMMMAKELSKPLFERTEQPKSASVSQEEERIKVQTIPKDFKARFEQNFYPKKEFSASYLVSITDKDEMLSIEVEEDRLTINDAAEETGDVILRVASNVLNRITIGEITFQRAFMSGEMKVKGDFITLRTLDQIFRFS